MFHDKIWSNARSDIACEVEDTRKDGKIFVRPKGTIMMLDEWLWAKARPHDKEPFEKMVAALKKVRSLRQKPAHVIKSDSFDQQFFHDQRHLLSDTYCGLQALRILFSSHPLVRVNAPKVPEVLENGPIWMQ